MEHQVEILDMPSTTVAVCRMHIAADEVETIGEKVSGAFGKVAEQLQEARVEPLGPPMAHYTMDADGFDVAAGFRVDPDSAADPGLELVTVGGGETAHLTHRGAYDDLPTAYEELQQQVAEAGRSVDFRGPMWEEYWSEPETPAEQTRTEIFWPVLSAPAS